METGADNRKRSTDYMRLCRLCQDMSQGMLQSAASTARERWAEPLAEKVPGSGGRLQRAAQTQTIISVVVIGVVGLIGILIFAQIEDALPAIGNTNLSNSKDSLVTGFGDAMELVPIVLLVLVAALVIGVVQRMRQ